MCLGLLPVLSTFMIDMSLLDHSSDSLNDARLQFSNKHLFTIVLSSCLFCKPNWVPKMKTQMVDKNENPFDYHL